MSVRPDFSEYYDPTLWTAKHKETPMETIEGLEELKGMVEARGAETKKTQIEALKAELAPLVFAYQEIERDYDTKERELKELSKNMNEIMEQIRKAWQPFIGGAEEARIDLGGAVLESKATLNIAAEDQDQATEWLMANGYEGAMKWQIHAQTQKKIAREEYEQGRTIPGLKYSTFNIIKVK